MGNSKGFWDNRINQNEEEDAGDPMQSGLNQEQSFSEESLDQVMSEVESDSAESSGYQLAEREVKTVSKAILRLEQGRLYQMLIEHNFFDGLTAMEEAVNTVQEELKDFIIERLEVLLGIREDSKKEQAAVPELPFNQLEITALKQIAYKITGGASSRVEPIKTISNTIKPLKQEKKAESKVINKISSPKPVQSVQKPIQQVSKPILKREPKPRVERKPSTKSPFEMTQDELIARNNEIPRQKRAVSATALPQPTADQLEGFFHTRLAQNEQSLTLAKLYNLAAKNKPENE